MGSGPPHPRDLWHEDPQRGRHKIRRMEAAAAAPAARPQAPACKVGDSESESPASERSFNDSPGPIHGPPTFWLEEGGGGLAAGSPNAEAAVGAAPVPGLRPVAGDTVEAAPMTVGEAPLATAAGGATLAAPDGDAAGGGGLPAACFEGELGVAQAHEWLRAPDLESHSKSTARAERGMQVVSAGLVRWTVPRAYTGGRRSWRHPGTHIPSVSVHFPHPILTLGVGRTLLLTEASQLSALGGLTGGGEEGRRGGHRRD